MTNDHRSWHRMLESMRSFFRTVPGASDGGRCLELDGVLATVTPAVPQDSLPNSVVYEAEDALIAALGALAEAYENARVQAWTVWVPEHHERAQDALAGAGHVLDANPTAMIASLTEVEPPRPDDPRPAPDPSYSEIARVNDLAYGTGDTFARILGGGSADPAYSYVAREDGDPVASVGTHECEGDCSVWWVATLPEARGRGLASGLMRRALADARQRGCDATTLQATKLGRPVYEALGYRALGDIGMWERRKPA